MSLVFFNGIKALTTADAVQSLNVFAGQILQSKVSSKTLFKTLPYTYNKVVCENSERLLGFTYFRKNGSMKDVRQGPKCASEMKD